MLIKLVVLKNLWFIRYEVWSVNSKDMEIELLIAGCKNLITTLYVISVFFTWFKLDEKENRRV